MPVPSINAEELRPCWALLKRELGGEFAPRRVQYEIYDAFIDENLERVAASIAGAHAFAASSLVDTAKPYFAVRPGTLLEIDDHLVFQACTQRIYDSAHGRLVRNVTADVVFDPIPDADPNRRRGRREWPRQLGKWRTKCKSLLDGGYPILVTSDIAGFYENVSHSLLFERLEGLGVDLAAAELLRAGLRRWTLGGDRGLPQGPPASAVLADIYLDDLDRTMIQREYAYTRWVDDIRAFAKTVPEAKAVLRDYILALRRLGLVVQSAKTRIQKGAAAREAIDPVGERKLGVLEEFGEDIAVRIAEAADYFPFYNPWDEAAQEWIKEAYPDELKEGVLTTLLDLSIEEHSAANARYLRYCLINLTWLGSDHAVPRVGELLVRFPMLTRDLVAYLGGVDKELVSVPSILAYLESADCLYEDTEIWLAYFLCSDKIEIGDAERATLNRLLTDRNRHGLARYYAALALGKSKEGAVKRDLRDRYAEEPDTLVREAIVLALRHEETRYRNRFYAVCRGETQAVDQAISFIQSRGADAIDAFLPTTGWMN